MAATTLTTQDLTPAKFPTTKRASGTATAPEQLFWGSIRVSAGFRFWNSTGRRAVIPGRFIAPLNRPDRLQLGASQAPGSALIKHCALIKRRNHDRLFRACFALAHLALAAAETAALPAAHLLILGF